MYAYAYILRGADGRYYYGSANDLIRRLGQHRGGRVKTMQDGPGPGGGGAGAMPRGEGIPVRACETDSRTSGSAGRGGVFEPRRAIDGILPQPVWR